MDKPEFDHWTWVDYWHPMREVVFFKRNVYKKALAELEPLLNDEVSGYTQIWLKVFNYQNHSGSSSLRLIAVESKMVSQSPE